jgi:hypothetical protein
MLKPSRALARVGTTLERLRRALYVGDVRSFRWRDGRWQEVPPHAWALFAHDGTERPLKSLEELDREVRIDLESLLDVFAETKATPVKAAGRKPGGRTRDNEIVEAFLCMVREGKVSFKRGGQVAAAKLLRQQPQFQDYSESRIVQIIRGTYNDFKSGKRHLRKIA